MVPIPWNIKRTPQARFVKDRVGRGHSADVRSAPRCLHGRGYGHAVVEPQCQRPRLSRFAAVTAASNAQFGTTQQITPCTASQVSGYTRIQPYAVKDREAKRIIHINFLSKKYLY